MFDSPTGFRLPENPVLFPDLVVELASTRGASSSDEGPRSLTALRQKMTGCQRNGIRLGWVLIPAELAVDFEEIWAG